MRRMLSVGRTVGMECLGEQGLLVGWSVERLKPRSVLQASCKAITQLRAQLDIQAEHECFFATSHDCATYLT